MTENTEGIHTSPDSTPLTTEDMVEMAQTDDLEQAAIEWIAQNAGEVQAEADRRHMGTVDFLRWMLEDALSVYAAETDEEIAESVRW